MRVLALDTTTRVGSVAVVQDDPQSGGAEGGASDRGLHVVAERAGDASRSHMERLPEDILALLGGAALTIADIDVFAVAVGPGSFTGLRIGIAAMQGLALVRGRPMVPVSLLEVLGGLAAASRPEGELVGAWIDAHRSEVYSALYRRADASDRPSSLVEVEAPRVGRPADIVGEWQSRRLVPGIVAGDGAMLYAEALGGACRALAPPPLAGRIGRLAAFRARAGLVVAPPAVLPLYVRRPDVEIARAQERDG